MHWVYIALAAYAALLCPIFADAYLYYDKDLAKFCFRITLYGIPVLGGYGEKIKGGLALHFSEKKAAVFTFRSVFGMRSQFNLHKDYMIRKIGVLAEYGSENAPALPFAFAFVSHVLAQIFGAVNAETGGTAALRYDAALYEARSLFRIQMHINVVFNLFTVAVTLVKVILRKAETWIKRTK